MHSEPITRSPSSLSSTRTTPCVDGCCCPMFRMSSSAPSSVCCFSPASGMVLFAMRVIVRPLLSAFDAHVFLYPASILLDDVVVLAQGIPLPFVRQQDAREIGMPGENDPKHVKGFALQPIGRGPNARDARNLFAVARPSLHAQALILRKGVEIEHHVEALVALGPIDGGQVRKQVELFFIAEILCNFRKLRAFHGEDRLLAILDRFYQRRSKLGANAANQLIVQRCLHRHRSLRRHWCGRFRRGGSRRSEE